ncbi:isopentenyl-diphosphate Delta-isomerase [Leptolyngbya sp. 7M]|uniref:isopentenyl-diphosphate Delta-isomerase n=1 Tax=Leptolyngbya sp. 7M TaxID=2812896 RepID=UPI001B8D9C33|nr:isopentenyl-diphosphate Delta-isomerase [Leptolyngbya sp. 7M]QYO66661.1 isopentenyl-diphosphate Delta-isomerase [Leptolyngbya sp. 7M]
MAANQNKQAVIVAAVLIFLAIGAFFMVNVELPTWSHYVSAINIALFALPSFWAVRRWLGWRDGSVLVLVLGVYALAIETSAIVTGFPYGHFGYSDLLGYRIFGLVPWNVAFAWTPLMLGAYAIAANLFGGGVLRVITATLIITLFDIVLDPGAVYLGFWQYEGGGWFYNVPISNFAGWLVSGAVGAVIIEIIVWIFQPLLPTPMQLASSVIFIVFFWSMIAAFGGLVWPALIGLVVCAVMILLYRRYSYAFDDKIVFVDEENKPIATGDKFPSHNEDTKLHRAFSVFLFNGKGEFLMQKRALSKRTWPGIWSNSCCGHVMLHESVVNAARRRLKFELGISGVDLKVALPDFRYRAEKDGVVENEICPVLIGKISGGPIPNPDEVAAVKWVNWKKFVASLDESETEISPWAVLEVRELIRSREFEHFISQFDQKRS